jgi:hypothetical protein
MICSGSPQQSRDWICGSYHRALVRLIDERIFNGYNAGAIHAQRRRLVGYGLAGTAAGTARKGKFKTPTRGILSDSAGEGVTGNCVPATQATPIQRHKVQQENPREEGKRAWERPRLGVLDLRSTSSSKPGWGSDGRCRPEHEQAQASQRTACTKHVTRDGASRGNASSAKQHKTEQARTGKQVLISRTVKKHQRDPPSA